MSWKARTRSLLAAALLLGVGFAFGTVFGLWSATRILTQFLNVSPDAPGPSDYLIDDIAATLTRKLDLTPAERAAVLTEMRATARSTKRLRAENTQAMRAILNDATDRMASHLPPEKAAKFRELTTSRLKLLGLEALLEPATK